MGDLFVSNIIDNTIEKFTPGGAGSVFASLGLSGPWGLAFGGGGDLYVANFGNDTIVEFTPAGVGSIFASTGLKGPVGLAFEIVPESSTYAASGGVLFLAGLAWSRSRKR